MAYEVVCKTVGSRTLAAARRQVRIGEIAQAFRPALDEVWSVLRAQPASKPGHNIFLYHHPSRRDDPMNVDFGVEIAGAFSDTGSVRRVTAPPGGAVTVMHIGPYHRLPDAHAAIHAWRAETGRQFGGYSWEIYGDWNDDASKLETEIMYLLA